MKGERGRERSKKRRGAWRWKEGGRDKEGEGEGEVDRKEKRGGGGGKGGQEVMSSNTGNEDINRTEVAKQPQARVANCYNVNNPPLLCT